MIVFKFLHYWTRTIIEYSHALDQYLEAVNDRPLLRLGVFFIFLRLFQAPNLL